MKINLSFVRPTWFDALVGAGLIVLIGTSLHLNHLRGTPDIKDPASTVVQLTDGDKGFCSGTLIDDPDLSDGNQKTILTAKHCVDEVGQVIKVPYSESYYDFVVKSISEDSDLAILQADSMFEAPSAKISTSSYYQERAWAIGYPLGLSQTISEGFLGAIDTQEGAKDVSRSTAFQRATVMIAPGSSGGGLFQIEGGEHRLMGIATGTNMKYFFITYWTPLEEIQDYLKKFGEG